MPRPVSWLMITALLLPAASLMAADVTLVENGQAKVSIIVPGEVLEAEARVLGRGVTDATMLRGAADDLVIYLGKISGAQVALSDTPVEGTLPIYLGMTPPNEAGAAQPEAETTFDDAYVIDVNADRIVLGGESPRAAYYAAARLLHQLGVRWYAPTELGEHVPQHKTVTLATGRTESTPDYRTRHIWRRTPAEMQWALRNRAGGPVQAQGHAFASIISHSQFDEHPEWFPVVDGQPKAHNVNVSNPEVLDIFVEAVRKRFEQGAMWVCVGPDDGFFIDERPESRAMGSGRIDPLLDLPSSTDMLVTFVNRIAERLEDDYGDRKLTFYVYSNHQIPPTVKPHPMVLGIMAPIGYSRYASTGNPRVPISMLLKEHTLAWAEATGGAFGFYLYDFNLADTAMPYSRRTYFANEIPNMHQWGATDATIQTMTNWQTMVPGTWLAANLLWDVEADVEGLLEDFYPDYYGPAAAPMQRYDDLLAKAYENTPAIAGNVWAMHRILLPIMDELESELAQAEEAVSGQQPYQDRVQVIRHSLDFGKHYFAAREALNDFELAEAARQSDAFLANYDTAKEKFPEFFDRMNQVYWNVFQHKSFSDAGRVAREGEVVYQFPDELSAYLDDGEMGHAMGLMDPAADTSNWITLRTHHVSLDEQGFPFFRGLIWYRHGFELPENARDAAQVKLWIGGMDGPTQVFLNGQDLGHKRVSNFNPMEWEITPALKRDGENVLIIASDNTFINELSTGGVMRPMLLYVPKGEGGEQLEEGEERSTDEAIFGGETP